MEKEKKVRQKINWKKEMKLAPGYIVIILWVIFTFMLLGWILAASLSTTTDIFAGKALKFPTGLHFENYIQAWGSGGVATFFMNSMLYSLISCFLLILICAPAAYVLARFTFLGNKIIQTSFVSAMGIPITMIVLPLFSIVANLGILNSVFASKVTLIFLYIGINIPYTTIFLLTFSRTCLEHMKRLLQLMAVLQRRHSGRLCSRWLSRESSQLRFSILSISGMNISCH